MCECAGCGRKFGGARTFDLHQRISSGRNVCLDPATIGMIKDRRGVWIRTTGQPNHWQQQRLPTG